MLRLGLLPRHTMMMKTLSIALCGGLAVLAVGVVLLNDSAPLVSMQLVEEEDVEILASPEIHALEETCLKAEPIFKASEEKAVEKLEQVQEPVLPVEERGDAMLFEMDALQGLPFDATITMPFD